MKRMLVAFIIIGLSIILVGCPEILNLVATTATTTTTIAPIATTTTSSLLEPTTTSTTVPPIVTTTSTSTTTSTTTTTIAPQLMHFDISTFDPDSLAAPSRNIGLSRSAYPLSPGGRKFTPTKFVMKFATVAVAYSTPSGTTRVTLFDKANTADCIAVDLANGEKLSDFLDASGTYKTNPVSGLYVAYLPTIDYAYQDASGIEHTGQLVMTLDSASAGYTATIGRLRGRICTNLSFLDTTNGWGDSRFTLSTEVDKCKISLYFDLDRILFDSDGNGSIDKLANRGQKIFPIVPGMRYDEYYFRKAGASGNQYPYRICVLYAPNENPVMYKVFLDVYDAGTASIPEFEAFEFASNPPRDNCILLNGDGSVTFKFSNGGELANLPNADRSNVPLGSSYFDMKYKSYLF